MFTKALSKDAASALAVLGKSRILAQAYLAGGTACALYFGHRLSYHLDFFTNIEFQTRIILKQLKTLPGFTLQRTAKWTILGTFPGVKFSYFYYPYPLIKKTALFSNIRIASPEDIAAMKIAAVCDRGTKRDFVDLYIITKEMMTIDDALLYYDKKYKKLTNNLVTILKSLEYFKDAEDEKLKMIQDISWKEVKQYFIKEVERLAKKSLSL